MTRKPQGVTETDSDVSSIRKRIIPTLMTMLSAGVVGLFTWGITMSKNVETEKEAREKLELDSKAKFDALQTKIDNLVSGTNQKVDAKLEAVDRRFNGIESDQADEIKEVEKLKDDHGTRILKLEDFNFYHFKK